MVTSQGKKSENEFTVSSVWKYDEITKYMHFEIVSAS